MKILLVYPPFTGEQRYGKLSKAGSYLPPLGLAYLAASVGEEHETRIIDGSVENVGIDSILGEISSWKPDILGVSVHTPTLASALELCAGAKRVSPSILTVLGGPHPSAMPKETIEAEAVDVVVVGEGEVTFRELVGTFAAGGDFSTVNGIVYRDKGAAVSTPPREPIRDLDALPFPARHLLPMHLYRPSPLHYKALPAATIVCGRGCPFKCTFCSCSKVFTGKMRLRSPTSVISEIKSLISTYGVREILVWDDLFGLSESWVEEFCALIAPLNILWSVWMRVDTAKRHLLHRMAESGCWSVSYGVEAGNQRVLDGIKKGITLEEARNAFRWTHEAGMEARGTFILGLPGDTAETMEETVNFAIELDADYAQFQYLTPYPGSAIWEELEKKGGVARSDFSKFTIWFPALTPTGLSKEWLEAEMKRAFRRFYFRPGYILRRLSHLRSFADIKRHMIGALGAARLVLGRN